MDAFEKEARTRGFKFVCGVDEAGRGPLAGPVVAAAVVFDELPLGIGIKDSKKLSGRRRTELAGEIRRRALATGFGIVEPDEIDRLNILRASLKAMRLAIENLANDFNVNPDIVLVDGPYAVDGIAVEQKALVSGDNLSVTIAAASILAKTTRDSIMAGYEATYPGYGFASHKGYPTRSHVEALNSLGVTPAHRRSYALVKKALEGKGGA